VNSGTEKASLLAIFGHRVRQIGRHNIITDTIFIASSAAWILTRGNAAPENALRLPSEPTHFILRNRPA
jgi:hypothetical protein